MDNNYLKKQLNYALGETIMTCLIKGLNIISKYRQDPYIYAQKEYIHVEGLDKKYMTDLDIKELENLAWQYELREQSYYTSTPIWRFKPE